MNCLQRIPATALLLAVLGACSTHPIDAGPYVENLTTSGGRTQSAFETGKRHLVAGNLGSALSSLRKANVEHPGDVRILNALGVTYDRLGRFDVARRYYHRALAVAPESAQTLNNLGYSRLLAGDNEKALTILRRAYEKGRGGPQIKTIVSNLNLLRARIDVAERREGVSPVPESGLVRVVAAPVRAVQLRLEDKNRVRLMTRRVSRGAATEQAPRRERPSGIATFRPLAASRTGAPPQRPRGGSKSAVIEVCNGAGRRALASRFGRYFTDLGNVVGLRTNDVSFDHRSTVIFYRAGALSSARSVAQLLPFPAELREVTQLIADVKVRLGGDSLAFDEALIRRYRAIDENDRGEI